MSSAKTSPYDTDYYVTQYSDLNGVDFSSGDENVYKKHSPTGYNMISDLGGNPKKRRGWEWKCKDYTTYEIVNAWGFSFHEEQHLICHIKDVSSGNYYLGRYIEPLEDDNGTGVKSEASSDTTDTNTTTETEETTTDTETEETEETEESANGKTADSKDSHFGTLFKVTEDVVGFFTATDQDSVFQFICSNVIYEYKYYEERSDYTFGFEETNPYIPLTVIGGSLGTGGGTMYEGINILTRHVQQQYLGTSTYEISESDESASLRTYATQNEIVTNLPIDDEMEIAVTLKWKSINKSGNSTDGYKYTFGAQAGGTGVDYEYTYTYDTNGSWSASRVKYTYVSGVRTASTADTTDPTDDEISIVSAENATTSNTIQVKPMIDSKCDARTFYPWVDGEDNITVTYYFFDDDESFKKEQNAFLSCDCSALFENRVWLSGASGEYGNRVWYSDITITDASYYPETNYVIVGSNDTDAKGLVNLGEYLGVVKQPSAVETTVFLVYSTTFDSNAVYACKNYVSGVGALASKSFANMSDESLFLGNDGIYGLSSSAIKNRSYYINKMLFSEEENLENACAIAFNGYYILGINDRCYIMDTRQKTSWGTEWTNYLYECYFWLNVPAVKFVEYNDELWFIHKYGGLCKFRTEGSKECYRDGVDTPIYAEWSTPLDDDGATQLYKTLEKKGSVATIRPYAHTSAELYINVDDTKLISIGKQYGDMLVFDDVRFDRFTFVSNDSPFDMFFKKKVKKYKRLQFILKNNVIDEPFMIEAISKTYTIKGYAKRKSGDGVNIVKKEKK